MSWNVISDPENNFNFFHEEFITILIFNEAELKKPIETVFRIYYYFL